MSSRIVLQHVSKYTLITQVAPVESELGCSRGFKRRFGFQEDAAVAAADETPSDASPLLEGNFVRNELQD